MIIMYIFLSLNCFSIFLASLCQVSKGKTRSNKGYLVEKKFVLRKIVFHALIT